MPPRRRRASVACVAADEPDEDETAEPLPPEIVELARSGHRLEALRRYRDLTGADLDEARDAIGS
jgi:ribosomal protein L7/L12